MSDFDFLANPEARSGFGLGSPQDVLPVPPLQSNMSALAQYLASRQQTAADQAEPTFDFSVNGKTGEMTVKGPGHAIMQAIGGAQKYQKVLEGYADQVQRRQTQAEAHPIPGLLALLAGNMAAADPHLPGWIRGLGQTAAQLNPTAQQLQQQGAGLAQQLYQMSVQNQEAQVRQRQVAVQEGELRLNQALRPAEHQRKLREDYTGGLEVAARTNGAAPDKESFIADGLAQGAFRSAAEGEVAYRKIRGLADSRNTEKATEAAKAADSKEQIMKFGQGLAQGLIHTRAEEARATETAKQRGRLDLLNLNWDKRLGGRANAFEFQKDIAQMKAGVHEQVVHDLNLKELKPPEQKILEGAFVTDKYLDTLQSVLNRPELKGYVGPLFTMDKDGRVTTNVGAIAPRFEKSADRVKVENLLTHEIPRILDLVLNGQGGGSRLLQSPTGQKMLADLGINRATRPDQALAILGNIRDLNNQKRLSIRVAHNLGDEYGTLLGLDNPNNAYFWGGGKDTFGAPVQGGMGGPAPSAAPVKPGQKVQGKYGEITIE